MATRSLNKVQLIGNLTRDPELRYTPAGTAVCTFGLATNRSWTTDAGEKREEAEFHRIVAWNKLAELCAQLIFKGRKVYVEGRLQTREWTTREGQPRQTTEIVISDMLILDSRRQAEEGKAVAPVEEPSVQVGAQAATDQPATDQPTTDQPPAEKVKEPEVEEKEEETGGGKLKKKSASKKTEKRQEKKSEEEEPVGSEDIPF